jgi:hypothetical protein
MVELHLDSTPYAGGRERRRSKRQNVTTTTGLRIENSRPLQYKHLKKGFTYMFGQVDDALEKLRGLVRLRIIPTEKPPLVGEVSANFSG